MFQAIQIEQVLFPRFKHQGCYVVQTTELYFSYPNDDIPDVTLIYFFSFNIFFPKAGVRRQMGRRMKVFSHLGLL